MSKRMGNVILGATLVILVMVNRGYADLSTGLVAYYPFSGNANDASSNGNHGTVLGATLTQDMFGNADSAYYFDGINDYIVASATNLPTAERTVSVWFYTDTINRTSSGTGHRPALMGYGGYNPYSGRSWLMGLCHWGHYSMGVTSHWNSKTAEYFYLEDFGTAGPIGAWYHFAITTSITGTDIYVNGAWRASDGDFFNNTYVNGRQLAIGTSVTTSGYAPYQDGNVGYWKGAIDDVRIYNRALSASEIAELYDSGPVPPGGNVPPLVDAGEDRTCHRHVEINFTASFLDDLSDTHTAWWDFDGDGTFDQEGIVEEEGGCGTVYGTHVYTLPGEYTAWVCVQDDKGESACDDIIITVLNTPPVAQCQDVLVPAGIDGYADPSVDGGSYDPDGDDITLEQDPPGPYPVGVHHVGLSVTDPFGAQDTCEAIIVVYDPSGGFVTGGGWIWSPEGAFIGNPSVTGKANFGFVSKYQKGAMIPTGQTEFVFQAGDLNFHSSSYEWLVVTGSNYARFKGTGTINGSGEYEFMLWAGDDNPDTFRIKIWTEDESGVEDVVYDNDMDQPISGGSIVVHTK